MRTVIYRRRDVTIRYLVHRGVLWPRKNQSNKVASGERPWRLEVALGTECWPVEAINKPCWHSLWPGCYYQLQHQPWRRGRLGPTSTDRCWRKSTLKSGLPINQVAVDVGWVIYQWPMSHWRFRCVRWVQKRRWWHQALSSLTQVAQSTHKLTHSFCSHTHSHTLSNL